MLTILAEGDTPHEHRFPMDELRKIPQISAEIAEIIHDTDEPGEYADECDLIIASATEALRIAKKLPFRRHYDLNFGRPDGQA
jgi:hypothetical protein